LFGYGLGKKPDAIFSREKPDDALTASKKSASEKQRLDLHE
jgi:hypothetical protein